MRVTPFSAQTERMSDLKDAIHDGPFLQPLAERDRWPGNYGMHILPEKMASGNLPSWPGEPIAVEATPFKNLKTGR